MASPGHHRRGPRRHLKSSQLRRARASVDCFDVAAGRDGEACRGVAKVVRRQPAPFGVTKCEFFADTAYGNLLIEDSRPVGQSPLAARPRESAVRPFGVRHPNDWNTISFMNLVRRAILGVVLVFVAGLASACSADHVALGNKILLLHGNTGGDMLAIGGGKLGANSEGCITMGKDVVVAPDGSKVRRDGSIEIAGRVYSAGAVITFGGGIGAAPSYSPCGSRAVYWYV